MKINRAVGLPNCHSLPTLLFVVVAWTVITSPAFSQTPPSASVINTRPDPARVLLSRVIEQIALGPAFDAKIRQRVWVGGRDVLGAGTYEQAGDGSGCFNLQVAMHDGDGKHTLQQISDGRLAWTREQIGDDVTLQRVDVGRLDQWMTGAAHNQLDSPVHHEHRVAQETAGHDEPLANHLPPSVRVGAWTEMLEQIAADHDLSLASGHLEQRDVWIVRGKLRPDVRAQRLEEFGTQDWPELCPSSVVIAIAKSDSIETGFGQGLPLRIEFMSDPVTPPAMTAPANTIEGENIAANPITANNVNLLASTSTSSLVNKQNATPTPAAPVTNSGTVISLIELYSIRPISAPPIGRFRFDNQDMEVNFTNDTDRYLARYGIHLTERQSRLLRR